MNIVDIVLIIIILFFGVLGFKRGVVKSLVQLVGTICITVIAYLLKDYLAKFLMGFMPFFNFTGIYAGITAMNVLIYEMLSFVVIFVILDCGLNILLSLSGFVEKILKFTIVLAIPSKIMGALLGLIEGLIFAFVLSFVALHLPQTEKYVMDSKLSIVILERTPFVGNTMKSTTLALQDIQKILKDVKKGDNKNAINAEVVQELIRYNIVPRETIHDLIKKKKIDLGNIEIY